MTLIYFIVLIGILIFIHEGGHFLAAKLFKVKVLVFSLGMGPKIFGFKKSETEYRISAVPIGGYVKMLGQDPSEMLENEDVEGALHRAAAWKQIIIYSAGPAMNLIFPLFLYFFVAMGETSVPPAIVGQVIEASPAQESGLRAGDRVLEINGKTVLSYMHMVNLIRDSGGKKLQVQVQRGNKILMIDAVPALEETFKYPGMPLLQHLKIEVARLGIWGVYSPPVLGVASEGIALDAGFKTFDKIVEINKKTVLSLYDVEVIMSENAGKEVEIGFLRRKEQLPKSLFPSAIEPLKHDFDLSGQPSIFEEKTRKKNFFVPKDFDSLRDVGITEVLGHILYIEKEGPAAKAGLLSGDKLLGVDGNTMTPPEILADISSVKNGDTREVRLQILRDGQELELDYKADFISGGTRVQLGLANDVINPGFYIQPVSNELSGIVPDTVKNQNVFEYSIFMAVSETLLWSEMIIDVLKSVFTGNISPKMFSGPIGIAQATAQVSKEGPSAFLGFMGFLSINLGLMNLLLPIPILDGGRLVLIFTEAIMRRKLSIRAKERIMIVGAVMILILIVWAVIWDIARLIMA